MRAGRAPHQIVFAESDRKSNWCNWCGAAIEKLLIHHGDGDHSNNDPVNLWALCGNTCHTQAHMNLLDHGVKMADAGIKRWEDPAEREKASQSAIRRYEAQVEREKTSQAALKRYESLIERGKTSQGNRNRFENPAERDKLRQNAIDRYQDPAARQKQSQSASNEPRYPCPTCGREMRANGLVQHLRSPNNACSPS